MSPLPPNRSSLNGQEPPFSVGRFFHAVTGARSHGSDRHVYIANVDHGDTEHQGMQLTGLSQQPKFRVGPAVQRHHQKGARTLLKGFKTIARRGKPPHRDTISLHELFRPRLNRTALLDDIHLPPECTGHASLYRCRGVSDTSRILRLRCPQVICSERCIGWGAEDPSCADLPVPMAENACLCNCASIHDPPWSNDYPSSGIYMVRWIDDSTSWLSVRPASVSGLAIHEFAYCLYRYWRVGSISILLITMPELASSSFSTESVPVTYVAMRTWSYVGSCADTRAPRRNEVVAPYR